jgi:hypothetical protein
MKSNVTKIVSICNRLSVAPEDWYEDIERELVEAAKELVNSEAEPPPGSARNEIGNRPSS